MAVMTDTTKQVPARPKRLMSTTIQRTARLVGLLILIMAVFAPFGMIYVPAMLIVPGDAATTAQNIMASEGLFRLGIASDAVVVLLELVIVVLLFGAGRLPQIGAGIGEGIRNFKKAMKKEDEIDVTPPKPEKKGEK